MRIAPDHRSRRYFWSSNSFLSLPFSSFFLFRKSSGLDYWPLAYSVAIDLALDSKKRNLAWSFELDSAFTTMKSLQHTSRIYLRAFIILSSLSPSQERNFNTSATEISGLAENYYYEMGNHYPPNLIAPHPQPARSLMENWIASTGNNFDYPAVC